MKQMSTYSVLGIDGTAGRIGVASASCVIGVGGRVQFYRPGVGIVVTQHHDSAELANAVLNRMQSGYADLDECLCAAIMDHPQLDHLQLCALDFDGRFAFHSGADCEREVLHVRVGDFMLLGNTLSFGVVDTFQESLDILPQSAALPESLLGVMHALNEIGADKRGCESAALLVVPDKISGWESQVVNLRIDHSDSAVEDLSLLYRGFRRRFGSG